MSGEVIKLRRSGGRHGEGRRGRHRGWLVLAKLFPTFMQVLLGNFRCIPYLSKSELCQVELSDAMSRLLSHTPHEGFLAAMMGVTRGWSSVVFLVSL
eukprot:762995-Hanusia_phi.AAC.3